MVRLLHLKEVKALEKRIRELEMENEIKKAIDSLKEKSRLYQVIQAYLSN